MAGMFYSIQEVSEKLGRSEDEIKELVKQGRLREFRDGTNLLFKIDEVEALLADTTFMGAKPAEVPEAAEPVPAAEPEAVSEPQPAAEPAADEEITLAPEEELEVVDSGAAEPELAESDTALAGEGINVLGETDTEYKLADDSMAETKSGSAEAAALEAIEEDVNLDTFGSGSGLLDLSLQADDTSLGGILDEIYTSEGEQGAEAGEAASEEQVAAEAEQMISDESAVAVAAPAEAVMLPAYAEAVPDKASNLFGLVLIVPLLLVFYTTVVSLSAHRGVLPSVLRSLQSLIWPIVIGSLVVVGIMAGAAVMAGGSATGGKKAKVKKPKKEKKTKEKKEKKPKKEKKKKEKKSKKKKGAEAT